MTDHMDQPTDTTLAAILHADQADAETANLFHRMALCYSTLTDAGMKPRAAEALTATYSAMAVAEHFGVNVGESFAVGPLYGMGGD